MDSGFFAKCMSMINKARDEHGNLGGVIEYTFYGTSATVSLAPWTM